MRVHLPTIGLCLIGLLVSAIPGQAANDVVADPAGQVFRLVRAVMCESIEAYEPRYIAVAFPVTAGRISFYTSFDGVTDTTFIEHKWYRRDELITVKRLTLRPPNWATFSSIQLREADKGPWRVEIWDARSELIQTLRFSVIE
ncbi:MAG: DUF2914 domain-containing protein [Desulfatitalea sp.]|nr:DUF2914 domain-containing protein [Desulfatitalea sp.]